MRSTFNQHLYIIENNYQKCTTTGSSICPINYAEENIRKRRRFKYHATWPVCLHFSLLVSVGMPVVSTSVTSKHALFILRPICSSV